MKITLNDIFMKKACFEGLIKFQEKFPNGLTIRKNRKQYKIEIHDVKDAAWLCNQFKLTLTLVVSAYKYVFVNGNLMEVSDKGETVESYKYNDQNNLTWERVHGDERIYTYDETGKFKIRYDNPQTQFHVIFEYNEKGKLTRKIDSNGYQTTIEYDANNNPIKQINPDGSILTNVYDENKNRIKSIISAENRENTWEYNENNQLTKFIHYTDHSITYIYNINGKLISKVYNNGEESEEYFYNDEGELVEVMEK